MKRALCLIAASPVALALVLTTQAAHATGVSAGTLIENTATATYTTGSSTVSVDSNTVTVRVDELLDVAVANLSSTPVAAGSAPAVLSYSITNTGNGSEAFNLTVNTAVAGNDFDATVQSIVVDTNGNHTYDPGIDQVLAAGSPTPVIAANSSLDVFVLVNLPSDAADGETSQVQLTAEAATGTGTPGTTFAGAGQGGGDAVVGASGADDDALSPLVASMVTIALAKSAVIADPFGGTQPVPGAVVTYSIVATVTGSGTANGLHITDAYPVGTSYRAGTLKLDGGALTDGADADKGVANTAGVDVTLGTVAGGTSPTVSFQVTIN